MNAFTTVAIAVNFIEKYAAIGRRKEVVYDEVLAKRVRMCLDEQDGLSEQVMFGGLAFMVDGNMSCGVTGNDLIVRVGPDRYDELLGQAHVQPFEMTGRPMKGWVVVGSAGLENDDDLATWVSEGLDFARTLPRK